MPCRTVETSHGLVFVCSRRRRWSNPSRRCVVCDRPETMVAIRLCDAPVPRPAITGGRQSLTTTTCDAVVCIHHAVHVDPDTDYCPRHASCAPAPWMPR